jgi:hypothetical protein
MKGKLWVKDKYTKPFALDFQSTLATGMFIKLNDVENMSNGIHIVCGSSKALSNFLLSLSCTPFPLHLNTLALLDSRQVTRAVAVQPYNCTPRLTVPVELERANGVVPVLCVPSSSAQWERRTKMSWPSNKLYF